MNDNRPGLYETGEDQTAPLSGTLLKTLSWEQVLRIDDALTELGPFGEVRLIKAKGKVRFIQVLESKSML